MKKTFITALCIVIAIMACNKEKNTVKQTQTTNYGQQHLAAKTYTDTTSTATSTFISVNVANAMINSYLNSINSSVNDTDIHSFSINADTLRAYLANSDIKNIKICFGHTIGYMSAGYTNVNAGYQAGALTLIMAGYDASGNYVYYNGKVLDHLVPCPYTCPSGTAANDLFQ